jgi:cytoskeletal protein CcmA (bactofilin family)
MAKGEGAVDSFLGDRSRLEGTLTFNGTLTLHGKFKGRIKGGEEVVLGIDSASEAEVEAERVAVHGKLLGRVTAARKVEIHGKAEVEADIVTPTLVIHEGALIEGKCSMKKASGREAKEKLVDLREGWILPGSVGD